MSDVTVTVGVMVKNEAHSIREWIAHYMALGVNDIIVYDNESTDETGAICRKLASAGVLQYVYWPDVPSAIDLNTQVLESGGRIQDLIQVAGQSGMPIALNWKIFGSSGEKQRRDGFVTERFRHHANKSFHANDHIKTLGPAKVLQEGTRSHIHGWLLRDAVHFYVNALGERVEIEGHTFLRPPCWKVAWINHYIVKSAEEFEAKRQRGRGDRPSGDVDKYSRTYENYFVPYDQNDVFDDKVAVYRKSTKEYIERLAAILKP